MLEPSTKYLNYNQQLIYQQITEKYSLSQKNSKALIKYYNHFNKLLDKHITHQTDYIKNLFQISVIFTQKSNFYQTIDGRRLPGISFSLNDILKKKTQCQIKTFLDLTKQILTKTKFKDNTLKHQMQRLVIQIHSSLQQFLLFQKLFMIFYKTTVQQSYECQFYKNKLFIFSWYLYIDAKYSLLEKRNQSMVIKKFIMISILENVVLNSLEHVRPIVLEKGSPKRVGMKSGQSKKQLIELILSILLKQAEVSNNQILAYQDVTSAFDDYFDNLIQIAVIKSFSEDKFDYLCIKSLEINLRKLDRKINKQIKADQVDLRKFLNFLEQEKGQKSHKRTAIQDKFIKNRKRNQQNMKKKRQSILNDKQKVYKSHRVLNLDQFELNNTSSSSILTQENEKQCHQINQINIARQFIRDFTRLSIPFLHQVTQKDELSTFILQKTRPYISQPKNYQQSTLQMIESIHQKINGILQGEKQNAIKIRLTKADTLQTYEFYSYLTEQAWGNNQKRCLEQSHQHSQNYYRSSNNVRSTDKNSRKNYILQQSYSSYQSILILSISTILLNKYQKITIQTLNKLLLQPSNPKNIIQIDYINLFYTSIYIKQMLTIPNLMDKLIQSITDLLINEYLWLNNDFIEQLQYISEQIEEKARQNIFLKENQKQSISCIIQQIAEYVIKMTDNMIGRFGSSTNSSYFKQPLKVINPLQQSQLILNQSQNHKTQSYLAQWKSKTVSICLTILIYLPDILHLHTLNQIVLCTLYSTSKLLKLKIKFQDIIYVYKNYILKNNQQELQKTILNIRKNPNFTSANDHTYETHRDIIEFYNKQFIQYLSLSSCFNHQKKYLQWIQLLTNYKVEFDFCYQDQGLKKAESQRCYTSPNENQRNTILLSPLIKRKKSPIYQFYQNSQEKEYQNYQNGHHNHKKTASIYDNYNSQIEFSNKRMSNTRKNNEINIINLEQSQNECQQNNFNCSQGQLGIYSSIQRPLFQSGQQNNYPSEQNQSEKQNVLINGVTYSNQGEKKTININLQLLNNYNSRNPTRIKERKTIQQMNQWLCYTKKAKHPIFTQLRDE